LLDSQNKYADGLALTKRYLSARDDVQVSVLQTYFYVMTGDSESATSLINSFNANVQMLPFVRGVQARIKLSNGDAAGAVDDAKVAFEANQNAKSLQVLVMAYDRSDQADASYALLEKYSAENASDVTALMLLAEKQIGKDKQSAVANYKQALALNENNFVILNNLAYLLMEENRLDEASGFAQRAFDLQPDNAATVDTYAQILVRQDKHEEALVAYNRVMNEDVKNEEIFLNYIETLLLNGSKEIAARRTESRQLTLPQSNARLAELKSKYSF
jgi:Flp pilus assembly protein TadD